MIPVQSWRDETKRNWNKSKLTPIPRAEEVRLIDAYVRAGKVTRLEPAYTGLPYKVDEDSPARSAVVLTARVFGVTPGRLTGQGSNIPRSLTEARHALMWLMGKRGLTSTEIACALSCARSSVTNGILLINRSRRRDSALAAKLMRLLEGR